MWAWGYLDTLEGADIAHNAAQHLHIGRILAVLYPAADQFTQNAAEIFVAGVAQEAAAVRQHTHEVAQQAQVGQAGHLLLHARLCIVEPPGAAVLDLPATSVPWNRADDGIQQLVVRRIQTVQNGAGGSSPVSSSAFSTPATASPQLTVLITS